MKSITVVFENEEWDGLLEKKEETGLNWRKYILKLAKVKERS